MTPEEKADAQSTMRKTDMIYNMSNTMADVQYEMYVTDTIENYNILLQELGNCKTTRQFKKKAAEINDYLSKNADLFGDDSVFMSPALLENLEAVQGIEKILINQKNDGRRNIILFISGLVIGFLLNLLAGVVLS